MRPKLKICGVANKYDAELVSSSGADYCGVLLDVSFSERSLNLSQASEVAAASKIPVVILMSNPSLEDVKLAGERIQPFAIQMLCHETPQFIQKVREMVPCRIWKTLHLPLKDKRDIIKSYIDAGVDSILIDSSDTSEGFERMGGTGKVVDWAEALEIVKISDCPVFLAGGINPSNVEEALLTVKPFGVDLCSGVEAKKGKKDKEKILSLIHNFNIACLKIKNE